MDFEYTPEQIQLRKSVREFAEAEIGPHVMEWDEGQIFPMEVIRKLGKLGYMGSIFPEDLGGAGLGYIEYSIIIEELSRVDGSVGDFVSEFWRVVEQRGGEHDCVLRLSKQDRSAEKLGISRGIVGGRERDVMFPGGERRTHHVVKQRRQNAELHLDDEFRDSGVGARDPQPARGAADRD